MRRVPGLPGCSLVQTQIAGIAGGEDEEDEEEIEEVPGLSWCTFGQTAAESGRVGGLSRRRPRAWRDARRSASRSS